jgi:hypothetical protein
MIAVIFEVTPDADRRRYMLASAFGLFRSPAAGLRMPCYMSIRTIADCSHAPGL